MAQFEFSLNSSEDEKSSKHKSKRNQDQRERKIDVAVSKRLVGHALNQKRTHRNGHLYGNLVDETQNRNHGNRRNHPYQDDGSHSTLRHSNRNKDRKSKHDKRNPRKNRNSDGPSAPRNDRWNKDISSSTPAQQNRQGNKKSSGDNRRNESLPKPKTESKKPEFNIISSSEAIGVAAASNWAEDSDSDEGW